LTSFSILLDIFKPQARTSQRSFPLLRRHGDLVAGVDLERG
jgi:hypothetical protein